MVKRINFHHHIVAIVEIQTYSSRAVGRDIASYNIYIVLLGMRLQICLYRHSLL